MMNMKEEQVVTRSEIEYSPVIFYCQHQTAPFPARIWIPPFSDPIRPTSAPMCELAERGGHNMSAFFTMDDLDTVAHMPGSISESRFDNWYAGLRIGRRVPQRDFVLHRDGALSLCDAAVLSADEFPKSDQDCAR